MKNRRKRRKSITRTSKHQAKSKVIKKTGLQTEEKYLSVLTELPDIVYKIDQDGLFTFINNAVRILDYKAEELIGKHFSKIVHPDDVKSFSRHFVLPQYKGKTTGYEKAPKLFDERRTGKRKTKNLVIRLIPKKNRDKKPESIIGAVIAFGDVSSAGYYDTCVMKSEKDFLGTLGIIRNITATKQVEEKLHYQADLLQNVSDAIISTDFNFKIQTWNKAAEKMYGWKAHEVIGRNVYKVTKIRYPHDTTEHVLKEFFKRTYWQGETIEIKKDRTSIHVQSYVTLIKHHDEKPIGTVAVNRDITALKRAEEQLQQSEEKYRSIVELAPDGIIIVDKKGIITSVNTPYCKRTGYSKEDIIGKHISKIPTARIKDIPKYIKIFNALLKGRISEPFNFQWIRKDGTVYWDEVHVSIMKKDDRTTGFQAIIRDITERKKIEKALRVSLKEKEALIKEIHHRVKNNLQIISSLLNLQTAHIHDEYYKNLFRESQNRIKSMALVHEKLYQSKDVTAINVRDYINGLLRYLCHSYGIEQNRIAIKTDIEDITMNIDIAIPCGLIITELVSNSLTHAFVEPHRGSHAKITIKIHLYRKDKAVLIVSDNGIGFPDGLDFKKTESLGMQLVCVLTKQLSGNIKLTRNKGTTFTITFKKGS
jgi:PAS domain S-box-containing protein